MIDAAVECEVDGLAKGSHGGRSGKEWPGDRGESGRRLELKSTGLGVNDCFTQSFEKG